MASQYEVAKEKVTDRLKDFFRPEFLNRLDEIILFNILSPEALRKIVDMQVAQVTARLTSKDITLEIKPEVYEYLAKEGYNPHYGARPLNRLIQNKILNPVASYIISNGAKKGDTIIVSVKNNDLVIEKQKGHAGGRANKIKSSVRVSRHSTA